VNTGLSRFYQMFVLGPDNSSKLFWQISTDGNLMEKPVEVTSSRFSPAERVDVIVDFTRDAGKTFYLENRLQQTDGSGPLGNIVLEAGQGQKILKIIVDGPAVADNSIDPALIKQFYGLPNVTDAPRIVRTFKFERTNAMWLVNGRLPGGCGDPGAIRFTIKRNSVEKWILQNIKPGWQHPFHMHLESFQTLSINGKPPKNSGIVEQGRKDVLRLEDNVSAVVHFRFRDFAGKFPLHCHNILHEDHSMMVLGEIDDTGDDKTNP
jgi:FtsP/CotA-like multicopper oxidase with cupredoxin domain